MQRCTLSASDSDLFVILLFMITMMTTSPTSMHFTFAHTNQISTRVNTYRHSVCAEGIDFCYDCTCEVYVLYRYLRKRHPDWSVIYMDAYTYVHEGCHQHTSPTRRRLYTCCCVCAPLTYSLNTHLTFRVWEMHHHVATASSQSHLYDTIFQG